MPHAIDELLRGSIDLHMHVGPDVATQPHLLRRVDALEAARQAQAAGQRAIVFKSHQYHTAPLAALVSQQVEGVMLVGAVTLNHSVGGLNPAAVEASAQLGGRVVWMPTTSAVHHRRRAGQADEGGLSLLDGEALRLEVLAILDVVSAWDLVLCTGHIGPDESLALVREGRRRGLKRMVATHPSGKFSGYTAEQTNELADLGAFVEFVFLPALPTSSSLPVEEIIRRIRAVGVERSIVTTDFGQIGAPPPAEGMRMAISALLGKGMSEVEVDILVRRNPAQILGL